MRVATEALAIAMLSFSIQVILRSSLFGWGSALMMKEALLVSAVVLLAWLGVMARQDALVWIAGGFLVFESMVTWLGLGRRLLLPALLMLALYSIAAFTRPSGDRAQVPDSFPGRRGVPMQRPRSEVIVAPKPKPDAASFRFPLRLPFGARKPQPGAVASFHAPLVHPQGVPPSVRRFLRTGHVA